MESPDLVPPDPESDFEAEFDSEPEKEIDKSVESNEVPFDEPKQEKLSKPQGDDLIILKIQCSCGKDLVEMYCDQHEDFSCGACGTMKHRNCKRILSVDEMGKEIRQENKGEKTLDYLIDLKHRFETIIGDSEGNLSRLAEQKAEIIYTIKNYVVEMKEILDQLERSMIQRVNAIYRQELAPISNLVYRCKGTICEVDESYKAMKEALAKHENKELVVTHKNVSKEVVSYRDVLYRIGGYTKTVEMEFQLSENLRSLQGHLRSFGEIKMKRTWTKFQARGNHPLQMFRKKAIKAKEFNVGVVDDEQKSLVTGAAYLSGNKVILVDRGNDKVKLFGPSFKCIHRIKLIRPHDVTAVGDTEVAVTQSFTNCIQFVAVKGNRMMLTKNVSTDNACYGIVYSRQELVVTCNLGKSDPCVQLLSLEGEERRTIDKDGEGNKIFSRPEYVAVDSTGDILYISDTEEGIIGVERTGTVLFNYTKLELPRGLTTDPDGFLYACGYVNKAGPHVHQLTRNGRFIGAVMTPRDYIYRPQCLCCDPNGDNIIVTNRYLFAKHYAAIQYKLELVSDDEKK